MIEKFRHVIAQTNVHTAESRIRRTFVFVGKFEKVLGRSSSISSLSNMEPLDCRIRRTSKPATGHALAQTLCLYFSQCHMLPRACNNQSFGLLLNMTVKKEKARKAMKTVKSKAGRSKAGKSSVPQARRKERKTDVSKLPGSGVVADDPDLRRSARVAAQSAATKKLKRGRRQKDGSRFVKISQSKQELPMTVATVKRIYRMDLLQDFKDGSNRLPGHSPPEAQAHWDKLKRLPYPQRQKVHDRAYKKGVDRALSGTFGFRYASKRDISDHVWFWDQALGTWRYWIISGTGRVHETFHLTPPPTVQLA